MVFVSTKEPCQPTRVIFCFKPTMSFSKSNLIHSLLVERRRQRVPSRRVLDRPNYLFPTSFCTKFVVYPIFVGIAKPLKKNIPSMALLVTFMSDLGESTSSFSAIKVLVRMDAPRQEASRPWTSTCSLTLKAFFRNVQSLSLCRLWSPKSSQLLHLSSWFALNSSSDMILTSKTSYLSSRSIQLLPLFFWHHFSWTLKPWTVSRSCSELRCAMGYYPSWRVPQPRKINF